MDAEGLKGLNNKEEGHVLVLECANVMINYKILDDTFKCDWDELLDGDGVLKDPQDFLTKMKNYNVKMLTDTKIKKLKEKYMS